MNEIRKIVRKVGITVVLALFLPIIVCFSMINKGYYMIGGILFAIVSILLILLSMQIDKTLYGKIKEG